MILQINNSIHSFLFIKRLFQTYILCLFFLSSTCELKGFQIKIATTIKIDENDTKETIIAKAAHVVPTPNQYQSLKNEFIATIHWGPNTFNNVEWGTGKEDPKDFNPTGIDTDQWCKVLKEVGVKMVIFTAKHHDGYILWQSRYTQHGIMSSPFQDGKGDVVKNLSISCKKYGLKLGIYLSPADLYQKFNKNGLYANKSKYTMRTIPRKVRKRRFKNKTKFKFLVDDYNEYFLNQLFELLTEYGPIHEVWFDGAHPHGRAGQEYNYVAWKTLIKTLAPESVTFNKEDIRWCGNEGGVTRKSEWSIIPFQEDPNKINDFFDITGDILGSREKLYQGKYLHYYPAEVNTSIRSSFFYRNDSKYQIRSANQLFHLYENIVGGNSIFNINIPPNWAGRFDDLDVASIEKLGMIISDTYSKNLLAIAKTPVALYDNDVNTYVILDDYKNGIVIKTPTPISINRFVVQEAITSHSERIEKHMLDIWHQNGWRRISTVTNVGYKRIHRFPTMTSDRFRLRILESRLTPAISNLSAHFYDKSKY